MFRNTPALHILTLNLLVPLWVLAVFLTACAAPTGLPTETALPVKEEPTSKGTPSPTPTLTLTPTATAVRTPPALPEIYVSEHINPNDVPHTYIEDTCEYLKNKWDPNNARPGTVVMVIMLHSISRGQTYSADGITVIRFERMIENLREQGFKAIDTGQLAEFLESNAYIPRRSVVFLQDGQRTAENFNRHFRERWDAWGWPVVNAWSVQPSITDTTLQDNLILEQEGWVDHQLYSPLQRYNTSASKEFLTDELKKYTDAFEEQYGKAPIAIIWPIQPGDNFTQAARELGLRLGFTANARGPVMYNWILQADHIDPSRPSYYPEGSFDDPLMTLPRYWPSQVVDQLDQVRLTGKKATEYAEQNKEVEQEYYEIVCAPEYGEIR